MNSLSNDARDGPSASMNGSVAPIYASRWRFNLSGRGRVTEPGLSRIPTFSRISVSSKILPLILAVSPRFTVPA